MDDGTLLIVGVYGSLILLIITIFICYKKKYNIVKVLCYFFGITLTTIGIVMFVLNLKTINYIESKDVTVTSSSVIDNYNVDYINDYRSNDTDIIYTYEYKDEEGISYSATGGEIDPVIRYNKDSHYDYVVGSFFSLVKTYLIISIIGVVIIVSTLVLSKVNNKENNKKKKH